MKTGAVRVIPLGGLGEIGLNMMLVETEGDIVVIDAGLMFPEEEMVGVDFAIPDVTYLRENREKVRAILITHGHEDHTGALPFLLRDLPVPVYGTALTVGLIEARLREWGEHRGADLRPIRAKDQLTFGSLRAEFIQVSHSIPDGLAVALVTPAGILVHTGDFKFDQSPVDGKLTDYSRLAELGEGGVLLLMSDSTNASRPGFTPSERVVGEALTEIIRAAPRRVIIACFASNIHRVQQIFDVTARLKKRVVVSGKSMVANVHIAADRGYLTVPEGLLAPLLELDRIPPERVVIVTTGSQGEPLSAIARMAAGEHRQIAVERGDTVIFSARVIPGNEKAISRTINDLFLRGAEVVTEGAGVHVSGHASQEELKLMLNLTRPRYFVPIHGEYRHLHHHARLAAEVGLPPERIFRMRDGDVLRLSPAGAALTGRVAAGRLFVDGRHVGDVDAGILKERLQLAEEGVLLVVMTLERGTGKIVAGPEILSRGFSVEKGSGEIMEQLRALVGAATDQLPPDGRVEVSLLQQKIRTLLRRFLHKRMDRRPVILPLILEV